ncbi:hypothetical protein ACI2KR_08780 [Pseudomonas luteola]
MTTHSKIFLESGFKLLRQLVDDGVSHTEGMIDIANGFQTSPKRIMYTLETHKAHPLVITFMNENEHLIAQVKKQFEKEAELARSIAEQKEKKDNEPFSFDLTDHQKKLLSQKSAFNHIKGVSLHSIEHAMSMALTDLFDAEVTVTIDNVGAESEKPIKDVSHPCSMSLTIKTKNAGSIF